MTQDPKRVERRRSPRVGLRIPLQVQTPGGSVSAETAVVSRHGALIASTADVERGSLLHVRNLLTGELAPVEVAWCGARDAEDRPLIGIAFKAERDGFWGPRYEAVVAVLAG